MIYYLLVFWAAVLLAMGFALNKVYQKGRGESIREGLSFNLILGVFTALIMWGANGFQLEWSLYSLVMAALMAVFVGTYTLLGFRIIAMGKVAIFTQVLMLGGMIVPYVFGIFYLGEAFTLLRLLGLLLMTVSIILSGGSTGEAMEKKDFVLFLLLCAAVFFLNGGCSVTSKLHQIEENRRTVSTTAFVAYTGVFKAALSALMLPFFKEKGEKTEQKGMKFVLLVTFLSAILSAVSYLFQLLGASHLPATVLYPMITGGTVVLTALAGRICFHETLEKRELLGISLCFVATLMFL